MTLDMVEGEEAPEVLGGYASSSLDVYSWLVEIEGFNPGVGRSLFQKITKGVGILSSLPSFIDYVSDLWNMGAEIGASKTFHKGEWYCTNKPVISNSFDIPSGAKPGAVEEATLVIKFTPKWSVLPHDVHILVNGYEVGYLANTIPSGYYTFKVDSSYLNYASKGVAKNIVTLKTEHMNGGHYVVVTDKNLNIEFRGFDVKVCAASREEADEIISDLGKMYAKKADFAVYLNQISPRMPAEGEYVYIQTKVHNFGTKAGLSVPVELFIDGSKVDQEFVHILESETEIVTLI